MFTALSPREIFEIQLRALVEKFARNRAEYLSKQYVESQARLDFIDPLFEALGWDVRNRTQRSEREREVVVERGPTSGRPDYNFRFDGRTLFYVEAKAPHVPLADTNVILQAKRYAFGDTDHEVNFAAATDFEEFRFYDAHKKPDPRNPNEGLLFAHRYDEYLEPRALENLWQLSRHEIEHGSLDKWLTPAARRERQRAPLDQQFLSDLHKWRASLAKGIFRANPTLDAHDLNRATQILLDRLIFIRVAEDRSVLEYGQVREIAREWREERARPITTRLFALFREVNRRLNGEIFKSPLPDQLKWDVPLSKLLAEIILDGLEAYSFFKMPVELLGSIYERYLGKTLRIVAMTTSPRGVKLEDKPEVRKAGGVYYTPKYVVDYIVEQTVGKLVEGKSAKELAKLKILDPACGSGSFLLGAFSKLVEAHLALKTPERAPDAAQPALLQDAEWRQTRLTFQDKAAILKNNLFGVDIDPQAVEITMMSLYIKLLEGERGLMTGQGVLPRLNENILCGNSLIGFDIGELSDAERARINPFDWQSKSTGFGEIMASGGFDAVIGNPPYVSGRELIPQSMKAYISDRYVTYQGKYDFYIYFMEKGINLLREGGMFGFIVPNVVLANENTAKLRAFLLREGTISRVRLFQERVFPAHVETVIIILQKEERAEIRDSYVVTIQDQVEHAVAQKNFYSPPLYKFNVKQDSTGRILLDKINAASKSFGKLTDICIGIQLGGSHGSDTKENFLSDNQESEVYKPVLDGKEINRYDLNWQRRFVRYGDWLHRKRNEKYFLNPKIVVRQIGNVPIATFDDKAFYTLNTIYNIIGVESQYSLKYLLGLMNSSLLRWVWRTQSSDFKSLFPKIKKESLESIPIRAIDFTNPTDAAHHDQMVKWVERMLELHKQKQTAANEAARERIAREIALTDEKIDALVYELYGLTQAEIELVEGKHANGLAIGTW